MNIGIGIGKKGHFLKMLRFKHCREFVKLCRPTSLPELVERYVAQIGARDEQPDLPLRQDNTSISLHLKRQLNDFGDFNPGEFYWPCEI